MALGRTLRETIEFTVRGIGIGCWCRVLEVWVVAAVRVFVAVFSVMNWGLGACFFPCSGPVACHRWMVKGVFDARRRLSSHGHGIVC